MSSMGNFLWVIFGGLASAVSWAIAGALMCITIIGIPWGRACFTMASFVLLPFGREALPVETAEGRYGERAGAGRGLGNVLWFLLGGWYLALLHALAGIGCCLSVVGIPFGIQHFKLGGLAVAPLGKRIVDKGVAGVMRMEAAHAAVASRAVGTL